MNRVGDYSGMLYIIDSANGQLHSTYQCGDTIKTTVSIHSSIDLIYLGSHDQLIHAIQIQVVPSEMRTRSLDVHRRRRVALRSGNID